jgi:hypothetical protein
MLFKVLNLFGLDVPAKIAASPASHSPQRLRPGVRTPSSPMNKNAATAENAATRAAISVAAGVGLFALYRVIAEYYGAYAGLGAVAGLLLAAASVLLLAARTRVQSLSELRFVRQSSSPALTSAPEKVAAQASPARVPPETAAFQADEAAADLFEPLAFAFGKYVRFPVLGNPILDQFVGSLKASAGGTADDAVRRAANLIRRGDRTQLLAMIGGAAALGWLLARQNTQASLRDITPSG